MKLTLSAFIFVLALAIASCAQTATQNAPASQDNAAPQAKASCCHKAADAKEGESCPRHKMAGNDEKAKHEKAMSCCAGEKAAACCGEKEAKSCMKGDQEKAASSGDCCAKGKDEKGCCASHIEGDKTAMNCCGGEGGEHCAMHAAAGGK